MADDRPPVRPFGRLPTGPSQAIVGHIGEIATDNEPRRGMSDCRPAGIRWNAQNRFAIPKAPLKKSRNPKKTVVGFAAMESGTPVAGGTDTASGRSEAR